MSRHENEDVTHLKLPDPVTTRTTYYFKDSVALNQGQFEELRTLCGRENKTPPVVCAKTVEGTDTNIVSHYILCNNAGRMYDPKATDKRYQARSIWKFRRVKKSTFDLYTKFLKQNYKSLLHQAERGL